MKLAHQPARMHHAATLSPPPSTSCAYFPSLRGGCTLCALIAPVSAISVLRFFPSSSAQPLFFLSHPCNPSSFMRLRTLLHNGALPSLLFSMAPALFLSPRGYGSPSASGDSFPSSSPQFGPEVFRPDSRQPHHNPAAVRDYVWKALHRVQSSRFAAS